jgi:uncharacterized membrane protein YkoI
MKKILAASGMAFMLLGAAPAAQAQNNLFGDILAQAIAAHLEARWSDDDRNYGHHERVTQVRSLPRMVQLVENRSGGRVTDIVLSPNNRFYKLEGFDRQGRPVSAKADARTGALYDISRVRGHVHRPGRFTPIDHIVRDLTRHGYRNFDRVVYQERQGTYLARGLDRRGRPVNVKVAARNGHILAVKPARNYNGPAYAKGERRQFKHWRSGLQKQHYSRFTQIKSHEDYYDVRARDRQGRNVQLKVCAYTGKVLGTQYY